MSNNPLQPDLDALHQSAIDVITHVSNVMSAGCAILTEHDGLLAENQDGNRLGAEIKAIEEDIRHVNEKLERVKRQELTMTIVAPTSAGKSTIINAIAGQDLLPSRNDAMTVLPTEIVFSREVTRPKLILDKALMTLLREVWGQLHQKLQQIGLKEAVEQATKNDFPRENVIREILNSSSVSSQSEVEESNTIQAELIRINDLLRLCGIFGIVTDFLSSLSEIPRIEVPFPRQLSSLKDSGLGTLALVDTPGPSEDKSLNLVNVVKGRLIASSLVLVVVDYTKIGQTDPAKVKKLVDEVAEVKGRDRIYIIVNKIDDRDPNNPEDLTAEQILNLVKTKYEIDDPQNRVFEMSARQGFLATNFQREKEIYQLTELRVRKSFEALGQEYYAKSWRTQKTTVTLEEMQEVAVEFLEDSGFVGFINKAIAPLVTDAAPSMITIKEALKDIGEKLLSLQSCLKKQKEMLVLDIQKAADDIEWIKADLHEIELIRNDNGWGRISKDIHENLIQIAFEEISIIIENQINLILDERNPILEKISNDIIDALLRESAYEVGYGGEKFYTTYFEYVAKILEFYLQLSIDKNIKIKLIDWVNNYFSHCYNCLFDNAQCRLSRNLTFLPLDCLENVIPDSEFLESTERCINDYRTGSNSELIKKLPEIYYKISLEIHNEKKKYESIAYLTNNKMTKIMDGMFSVMDGILSIIYKPSDISRMLTKIVWRRYQSYYDQILRNDLYLLIEDYEKYLQSSIKAVKQKQDTRCMMMTNKYVQSLDKIANLEINLKYQQEYFQQY
ncbi:MAG: dynamin family protein [Gloeotrichia echinulata GP01]